MQQGFEKAAAGSVGGGRFPTLEIWQGVTHVFGGRRQDRRVFFKLRLLTRRSRTGVLPHEQERGHFHWEAAFGRMGER